MKYSVFLFRIDPDMFEYNKFVAHTAPSAIGQIMHDEDWWSRSQHIHEWKDSNMTHHPLTHHRRETQHPHNYQQQKNYSLCAHIQYVPIYEDARAQHIHNCIDAQHPYHLSIKMSDVYRFLIHFYKALFQSCFKIFNTGSFISALLNSVINIYDWSTNIADSLLNISKQLLCLRFTFP